MEKKNWTHINVGLRIYDDVSNRPVWWLDIISFKKAVLFGNNRLFESPTFEYVSHFVDVTITVAYYVRVSRHLSCRLSEGTRCWEKISFTLNTLLLYVVITTFSLPSVVGSRRGVSLLTYHFRLWSWWDIIAVKRAQVHSCQSRGPSLLTRCNVALTKG